MRPFAPARLVRDYRDGDTVYPAGTRVIVLDIWDTYALVETPDDVLAVDHDDLEAYDDH